MAVPATTTAYDGADAITRVRGAIDILRELGPDVEPLVMEGGDAAELAEEVVTGEKALASLKGRLARRVDETGAYRREGFRSGAAWLAAKAGMTLGTAISAIKAARALDDAPTVREAFATGRLSETHVHDLAPTLEVAPDAEHRLLEKATDPAITTRDLREHCQEIRASAQDQEARNARIRAQRRVRAYTDREGARHLEAVGPIDEVARVEAVLAGFRDRAFEQARDAGDREGRQAYTFDGLVALAEAAVGATDPGVVPTKMIVRADRDALLRGHVESGEVCEIDAVGPIPVSVAHELKRDAFLVGLLTRGTDIMKVKHFGRRPTAEQQSVLDWLGMRCSAPGCDERINVERDHRRPRTALGETSISNTDLYCHFHHVEKTRNDYRDGLMDAGAWEAGDGERAPP